MHVFEINFLVHATQAKRFAIVFYNLWTLVFLWSYGCYVATWCFTNMHIYLIIWTCLFANFTYGQHAYYTLGPVHSITRWTATEMKKKQNAIYNSFITSICEIFTRRLLSHVLAVAILSICLSHGWISQKRCKLGSPNRHRRLLGRL